MSNYEPTCFECGYPEDKCICKSSEMLNQEVEGDVKAV